VKKRFLVISTLVVAGLLSGCSSPSPNASSPLTVRIQLDRTEVPAGTPIHGVAIVTNNTTTSVPLAMCPSDWVRVGLGNAKVRYDLDPPARRCDVKNGRLARGQHRVPITVETYYTDCNGPHAPGGFFCTAAGVPVLTAGRYHTNVLMTDLPVGTPTPAPVWVTLTPAVPSVPPTVPHGTILVVAATPSRLGGQEEGPTGVSVVLFHDGQPLGVKSGSFCPTLTFRVAPGRYLLRSSAGRQATVAVGVGSTVSINLARGIRACGR